MKKTILILILIISLVLAGCETEPTKETEKEIEPQEVEVLCKSPYIEYKKGDCCLDLNNNNVCDRDEVKRCPASCNDGNKCTEDICSKETDFDCTNKPITPCCGDDVCESNENYTNCDEDCEKPKVKSVNLTVLRLDGQGYIKEGYKFDLIELKIKNTGDLVITDPVLELTATKITSVSQETISKSVKELDIKIPSGDTVNVLTIIPDLFIIPHRSEKHNLEFEISVELKEKDEVLGYTTEHFIMSNEGFLESTVENPKIEEVLVDQQGYYVGVEDIGTGIMKTSAQLYSLTIGLEKSDFYTPLIEIQEPIIDIYFLAYNKNFALYRKLDINNFKDVFLFPGTKMTKEIPITFTIKTYIDDFNIYAILRDGNDPEVLASTRGKVSISLDRWEEAIENIDYTNPQAK